MRCVVDGREVYAYTGTRKPVAAQPTIVFVHGAANDHSVWSLQSRYFAYHGYNVLAVDLPGHGKSAGPPLPSVEAIAAWLGALLTATGVGRAALAGHSLGSLAVLEAGAQMPARVQGIALLGPAVPMAVSDILLDAARDDEPLAYALINSWSFSAAGQLGASPFPGIALAGNALRLMERSAPGVLTVDLDACRHYANGIAAASVYRGPALVVMGARDQMAPPKGAEALIAALATPRVVQLPATGHALMAEQPDAVLDALIASTASSSAAT
jgi:pimeloyl-ACP methyl ester carboxylesterase